MCIFTRKPPHVCGFCVKLRNLLKIHYRKVNANDVIKPLQTINTKNNTANQRKTSKAANSKIKAKKGVNKKKEVRRANVKKSIGLPGLQQVKHSAYVSKSRYNTRNSNRVTKPTTKRRKYARHAKSDWSILKDCAQDDTDQRGQTEALSSDFDAGDSCDLTDYIAQDEVNVATTLNDPTIKKLHQHPPVQNRGLVNIKQEPTDHVKLDTLKTEETDFIASLLEDTTHNYNESDVIDNADIIGTTVGSETTFDPFENTVDNSYQLETAIVPQRLLENITIVTDEPVKVQRGVAVPFKCDVCERNWCIDKHHSSTEYNRVREQKLRVRRVNRQFPELNQVFKREMYRCNLCGMEFGTAYLCRKHATKEGHDQGHIDDVCDQLVADEVERLEEIDMEKWWKQYNQQLSMEPEDKVRYACGMCKLSKCTNRVHADRERYKVKEIKAKWKRRKERNPDITEDYFEEPYMCPMCNLSFPSAYKCRKHIVDHDNEIENQDKVDQSAADQTERQEAPLESIESEAMSVQIEQHKEVRAAQVQVGALTQDGIPPLDEATFNPLEGTSTELEGSSETFVGQEGAFTQKETASKNDETPDYVLHKMHQYPCELCHMAFKKQYLWINHRRLCHKDNDPFTCKHCSFKANNKNVYQMVCHLQGHEDTPAYCCNFCGQDFRIERHFRAHLAKHESTLHKCDLCDGKFVNKHGLNRHIRDVHSKEANFLCPHCGYKTNRKCTLRTHIASWHSDERPYKCAHCDYTAKFKGLIAIHMRRKHAEFCLAPPRDGNYVCHLCSWKTHFVGQLTTHLKRQHNIISEQVFLLKK